MRSKTDSPDLVRNFLNLVDTQFPAVVRTIRSDNGIELFNSLTNSPFATKGILYQSSCVGTPQQNGMTKRKYRNLLDIG